MDDTAVGVVTWGSLAMMTYTVATINLARVFEVVLCKTQGLVS